MLKKLMSRSAQSSPIQRLNHLWQSFLSFHTHICENERSSSLKPASSYAEIQGLQKIIEILIEEDSVPSTSRAIRPCLEYLITSKIFEILTAAAQIDIPTGLLSIVINFFTRILKEIRNQDFIPQMSFHTSISSLLHILQAFVSLGTEELKKDILKMIFELLTHVHCNSALMGLFVYTEGTRSEFLPVSMLMHYFQEEAFIHMDKNPFLLISGIKNLEIVSIIRKTHEFSLNLITKLAVYFQRKQADAVKTFAMFLQQFYDACSCKEFQEEIVEYFYENFCVQILTPRLQSQEINTRISATMLLTVILQELTSNSFLLCIVYFLQGKEKDGNKRMKPLVSTPTSSQKKSFSFEVDLNQGCKPLSDMNKMWGTMIENLNSRDDQLSVLTLKVLFFLLSNGGKKIVKLLITDFFSGCPPTGHVSITAEIFLSLIPPSILPNDSNAWFSEYLQSGYLRCSQANAFAGFSLNEYSEHTGAQNFPSKTGETGGTQGKLISLDDLSQKFFEGEILHVILMKFKNFLNNSLEENLYVTGIIATLSAYPKEIGSFSTLHNFLLEPQASNRDNFLNCLKMLALEIDLIISNDNKFVEKLEAAVSELGITSKTHASESFYESMISSKIKGKKSKSLMIEDKRNVEAVIVFQEFVKEMSSILLFKELLDDMAIRARIDDEENLL